MTHYIRHGQRYQVLPEGALDTAELLPLGTYKIGHIPPPMDEYFLEKIDDFAEPVGKVYGDTIKNRDRILTTFNARDAATGVLLSGEKGSGKTMLAKLLSLEAQEKGIPTIVINQPWHGDTFNSFMQTIQQEAVVVFDEFEKVYDKEQQEKLLTLLDGVYPSKKLFVLTANDRFKINEHMINRPGRIFYRINYGGLGADFIREYCGDMLENKERIESVVRTSLLFSRFNFDMLKALVEEMNRFDETADEALKLLNARPELAEKLRYVVTLFEDDGAMVPAERMHNGGEWRGNPLIDEVSLYYTPRKKMPERKEGDSLDRFLDDVEDNMVSLTFRPDQLVRVDAETGVYRFESPEGLVATLREKVVQGVNYGSIVY